MLCGPPGGFVDNGIDVSIWFWVAFNAGVLVILAVDLGVFHRNAHAPSVKGL